MISYRLPDQRVLPRSAAFECDGIAYPGNWLELASPEDLAARGIVVEDLPDPEPAVPGIDEVRSAAQRAMQDAADRVTRVATTSPEQAKRYLNKVEDVQLWLTREDVPAKARLEAEALARGISLDALILAIATKREQLKEASAAIEARRSATKIAIEQATTADEVAAALAAGIAAIEGVT